MLFLLRQAAVPQSEESLTPRSVVIKSLPLLQSLVALQRAGGMPTSDPAYQRGVQYLLKTWKPDGSWYVQSRSFPFQKQFESGFPYGKDHWISAAATSWAVMALALTVEPPAISSAGRPITW
jgi:hypothetical protein